MSDKKEPTETENKQTFEEKMTQAAQNSILALLSKGDWMALEYSNRVKIPKEILLEIFHSVDMEKVKARLAEKVEDRIVDTLFNSMATEVATDVKHVLSNQELRNDVREVLKSKIKGMASQLSEPGIDTKDKSKPSESFLKGGYGR